MFPLRSLIDWVTEGEQPSLFQIWNETNKIFIIIILLIISFYSYFFSSEFECWLIYTILISRILHSQLLLWPQNKRIEQKMKTILFFLKFCHKKIENNNNIIKSESFFFCLMSCVNCIKVCLGTSIQEIFIL